MSEDLLIDFVETRRKAKEIGAEIEPLFEPPTVADFKIFLGGRAMDEQLRGARETRYLKFERKSRQEG